MGGRAMEASIALSGRERKRLMDVYRGGHDPAQRLRAHILLLLAGGQSWLTISLVLFCSTATIARWKDRYERGGVEAVLEPKKHAGRLPELWRGWAAVVARWAKQGDVAAGLRLRPQPLVLRHA